MDSELLTAQQASELLANSVQHIRLLARTGDLKATKVGRDWLINRDAVMELQTKRATAPLIPFKRRGRPSSTTILDPGSSHISEGKFRMRAAKLTTQISIISETREDYHPMIDAQGSQLGLEGISDTSAIPRTKEHPAQVDHRNKLNELSATEWLPETVSVWVQKGLGANHPDAQIERQHPAPFSFTDVARLIRFFTKKNGMVLDPFDGIGSTLKAAALNERRGIGIELNPRYAQLTRERLLREIPNGNGNNHNQVVIEGDARDALPKLPEDSIDFVVTSPPYGNILHKEDHKVRQERIANGLDTKYSDDPRDLGNINDYETFLGEVTKILGGCGRVLKPNKYMAVVVGDYRHGAKYVMFHADIVRELEKYDFHLRGITVLYQRHKRVFPYGYPFSFVPNIHNQFILVMQNGKSKP